MTHDLKFMNAILREVDRLRKFDWRVLFGKQIDGLEGVYGIHAVYIEHFDCELHCIGMFPHIMQARNYLREGFQAPTQRGPYFVLSVRDDEIEIEEFDMSVPIGTGQFVRARRGH